MKLPAMIVCVRSLIQLKRQFPVSSKANSNTTTSRVYLLYTQHSRTEHSLSPFMLVSIETFAIFSLNVVVWLEGSRVRGTEHIQRLGLMEECRMSFVPFFLLSGNHRLLLGREKDTKLMNFFFLQTKDSRKSCWMTHLLVENICLLFAFFFVRVGLSKFLHKFSSVVLRGSGVIWESFWLKRFSKRFVLWYFIYCNILNNSEVKWPGRTGFSLYWIFFLWRV